MHNLTSVVKKLIAIAGLRVADAASFFFAATRSGLLFWQLVDNALRSRYRTIIHDNVSMKFVRSNYVLDSRIRSFSTKEPQTLRWIDSLPSGAVLWDVGANIGLYTVYAAKKGINVYAFEPSPLNLRVLSENLSLNRIGNATVMPLPLNDTVENAEFECTQLYEGASQATFSHGVDQFGAPIRAALSFRTVGVSIDWVVAQRLAPPPDYVKLDVDGIEHLILKGGTLALSNCKSLLVEVNPLFVDQRNMIADILNGLGFSLESQASLGRQEMVNQVWIR